MACQISHTGDGCDSQGTGEGLARVLVFGKLPPIQGGVAATTMALVGALQRAGHDCTVITNSPDVFPTHGAMWHPSDEQELLERIGSAKIEYVHGAEGMWHIPYSEAYVTRTIAHIRSASTTRENAGECWRRLG